MERIKQQVDQLQQQLAGLSLSQKMLTATLLAIMIATVVWWANYAASGEKVVLLDQAVPAEQMGAVQNLLRTRGIQYEVVDGQILVSADRQQEALGLLAYEQLMPQDLTNYFDKAIGQIGSFDPSQKTDLVLQNAAQNQLAGVLSTMPHVRSAKVFINPVYKQQIGNTVEPSASIHFTTDGAADRNRLANGAARFVAGAVSMLKPTNVTVLVDGGAVDVLNNDTTLAEGSQLLQLRANSEKYYEDKVRQALRYIPGLHVVVGVEVNDTVSRRSQFTVDPENKVIVPIRENNQSEDMRNAGGGGEPGAVSNISMSLAGGSNSQQKSNESSETENLAEFGKTREETYREAGGTRPISCTLSVPMSWLAAEWRSRNGTTTDPDPQVLSQYEAQRLEQLKRSVRTALQNIDEELIFVGSYADSSGFSPSFPGGATAVAGGSEEAAGISGLIRDYGKEVAVGALAVVSLFLVSTMVKKSAPMAPPAAPSLDGETMTLIAGEDMAGIAGEADNLLMAHEISDDALHAGQMLEQVQTLVKENPDAAAALVRRWLATS